MAKNQLTVNVSSNDLMNAKKYQQVPTLIVAKPLKVDFDVLVDKSLFGNDKDDSADDIKTKAMSMAARRVLRRYEGMIAKQLDEVFPKISELHEAEKSGSKDAFSNAKGILDKANSYIEDLISELRIDTRKAIAEQVGIKAKEMQTIGSVKFDKMTLARGAFETEVSYDSNTAQDISKELKKNEGKWVFFALLATNTKGVLAVEDAGPVSKMDIQLAKDGTEGNATLYTGILKPEKTVVTFRFRGEKQKPVGKDVLKKAIAESASKFTCSKCKYGDVLPRGPLKKADLKEMTESGGSSPSSSSSS